MPDAPDGLLYSPDDVWVDRHHQPPRIGITDFAQDQLGELIWFELPDPGTVLVQGEALGEVESTKTINDLVAPVNGRVASVNQAVVDDPAIANGDPYVAGWVLSVELDDGANGVGTLMSAEEYRARTRA